MKNSFIYLLIGLAALMVILTIMSPKREEDVGDGLLPNGPAPPMRIKSPDGTQYDIADLKGKVVLVKFWATWCGPCAMSTPSIQQLYEKRHSEGLEVIGVALENDDGKQIPRYVKEMGVTYPVGMPDPASNVGLWISRNVGIPAVFILDKKGNIRWSRSGFDPSREHEIEDKVVELLRE